MSTTIFFIFVVAWALWSVLNRKSTSAARDKAKKGGEEFSKKRHIRRKGLRYFGIPFVFFLAVLAWVASIHSTTGAEGWIFIFSVMLFCIPAAISVCIGIVLLVMSCFIEDDVEITNVAKKVIANNDKNEQK